MLEYWEKTESSIQNKTKKDSITVGWRTGVLEILSSVAFSRLEIWMPRDLIRTNSPYQQAVPRCILFRSCSYAMFFAVFLDMQDRG